MQARELLTGHCEQTKWVVITQIGFGHEGKLCQVRQGFHVIGVYTGCHAFIAKRFHVVVGVAQRPLQSLQLQGCDLVATGALDGFEVVR